MESSEIASVNAKLLTKQITSAEAMRLIFAIRDKYNKIYETKNNTRCKTSEPVEIHSYRYRDGKTI